MNKLVNEPKGKAMKSSTKIAGGALLTLLILLGTSVTPDAVTAQEREGPPKASKEQIDRFVEAVKQTEDYKAIMALPVEEAKKLAAEWSEKTGLQVEVETQTMLNYLLHRGIVSVGAEVWELYYSDAQFFLGDGVGDYEVDPDLLADLNVQVVAAVSVLHPLSRELERHEAHNQPLADVVVNLCRQAGVNYSIRSDRMADQRVTQSLRGRSIFECLRWAAESCGWRVQVSPSRLSDQSVGLGEVLGLYRERHMTNILENLDEPIQTPVDALQYALQGRTRLLSPENITVTLTSKS